MVPYVPSPHTLVLVGVFAVWYLALIVRKAIRRQLDLYDIFMLSMVAVVPAAFAFSPALSEGIADLAGVAFPFVVMFGLLLAVLFILVHRLTTQMRQVEDLNRSLVQELSLMRLEYGSGSAG